MHLKSCAALAIDLNLNVVIHLSTSPQRLCVRFWPPRGIAIRINSDFPLSKQPFWYVTLILVVLTPGSKFGRTGIGRFRESQLSNLQFELGSGSRNGTRHSPGWISAFATCSGRDHGFHPVFCRSYSPRPHDSSRFPFLRLASSSIICFSRSIRLSWSRESWAVW